MHRCLGKARTTRVQLRPCSSCSEAVPLARFTDRFVVDFDGDVAIGGTTSPIGKFHIDNDVTGNDSSVFVLHSGNVGIGTATPSAELEIAGWIGRTEHNNGGLVGSYDNIGVVESCTEMFELAKGEKKLVAYD